MKVNMNFNQIKIVKISEILNSSTISIKECELKLEKCNEKHEMEIKSQKATIENLLGNYK